ncbi:MAG TPA: D-glycerate dehydrogenase [Gaiellaceae bacterium]|nr:D-glycerate dehydrogenase [Gaiellaceae bacterium]
MASPQRPRVHVTGPVPARITAELERDFDLARAPAGADGILSLLDNTVDDAYLEQAGPQLEVVANYAVGVNNIDLDAARRRGIVIANTPDVLTKTTAELAVTLTLTLLRRVAEGDRMLRRREPWGFSLEFMLGESLDGKTLGIVGPGRIGRETARLAEAFGAEPLFAGRGDSLPDLLARSDIVSIHCPLTAETHHLIDGAALGHMRPTAVLVNTARGPIVDEAALVAALRSGAIAGAALDVFEFEPAVSEELLALENVVLCPHLGSATRTTREAMGMLAVEALRAVLLRGERPANTVAY